MEAPPLSERFLNILQSHLRTEALYLRAGCVGAQTRRIAIISME